MLNKIELLKLLLSEILIDHFEIIKFKEKDKILHLYFEEKNSIPKEFSSLSLQSKGFQAEVTVDDFPLRGKSVKLHIKRRRRTEVKSGNIIQRDWKLIDKEIAEMYGVNGKKIQRQYKKSISYFKDWEQKSHAEDWILYPENTSN